MGLFDRQKEPKQPYEDRLNLLLGRSATAIPPVSPAETASPAQPQDPAWPDLVDAIAEGEEPPLVIATPVPVPVADVVARPVDAAPLPESPQATMNLPRVELPISGSGSGSNGTAEAPAPPASAVYFFPTAPETLEETGLTAPFIQDHLVRILYFAQQATGAQVAEECGLSFMHIVGPQLEALRHEQFVEVKGQRGMGDAGYVFALTAKGAARALEALQKSQYRGALPVPLDRYIASVKLQTLRHVVVTEENIRHAFSDLILDEAILDQVGPAVNSASAMFLFGYPGNGKTSIAERITNLMGDHVYIPHAVEVDGYVVKLFDQLVHEPVGERAGAQDGRWVRIKRPTLVVGGELTMASLDLLWNEFGRFYEAPLQMKANLGMFLIDDFGRQMIRPQDLLNRWIVPLEKRVDYLTLITGKKVQIPFDQLIVFSTNLDPNDLVDDAFLRRIKFKIDVKDPTREHFTAIMQLMCNVRRVPYDPRGLDYMLDQWWAPYNRPLRMCQPRDILDQMIAIAKYKQVPPQLSNTDLIDRACATYFVSSNASAPKVARS